jgi:hypothetical protein
MIEFMIPLVLPQMYACISTLNSFNLSIIQWIPASFPGSTMHWFRGFLISFNSSFHWLIWTIHVLLDLFIYSIFPASISSIFKSVIIKSHNHSNYWSDNHKDCQSHHHTQLHYVIHFKLSVSSTVSLSYKNIASCPNYCSMVIPLLHIQTITACPNYCSMAIILQHGHNLKHGQTNSAWSNCCHIQIN